MNRFTLVSLIATHFASSLLAAGCTQAEIDDPIVGSAGELGVAHFRYSTESCMLLGCSFARSRALSSSRVSATVLSADPSRRLTARLTGTSTARITSQHESCECIHDRDSSSIEPSASCADGEAKRCWVDVDIETGDAGDPKLELVDASGALYDRATMAVRRVARLGVRQHVNDEGDFRPLEGPLEIPVGGTASVAIDPADAENQPLVLDEKEIRFEYADPSIVAKQEAFVSFGDLERMEAKRAGETQVTVRLQGAEAVVHIRVR